MNQEKTPHTTVLLQEAVSALIIDRDGFYVDGTFGRGGHSRAILAELSDKGRLLGVDKDPAAEVAAQEFAEDSRFEFARGSFTSVRRLVEQRGQLGRVSGVLLDLGVSSPQLDEAERGFSFSQGGPLDMRMDPSQGMSAADWIATAKEAEIAQVLRSYGEERFARRISRAIVAARMAAPIERTDQLARIVAEAHPAWEPGKHPATRSFLGIRLFINRELEDLEELLSQVVEVLAPGGRLVVISFHSLEDRIVKRFIRRQAKGEDLPRGLPVTEDKLNRTMKAIGKAQRPGDQEVNENVRARSAIMRVAEKLAK
ncbi:16S rRNA (cytosine(1402)-N(4))-methyltransferase RsmH [Gilvimarinus sp. F26214L]|uniref:16S rRNA (cytosine(1402)-N(4))-methyltransferase RsmH n=1 Tax=Gilvimarinus sp. DZF01 TaxID=3461371 RepID=UPI00404615AF